MRLPKSRHDYPDLMEGLAAKSPAEAAAIMRGWAQSDLFFLLVYVLNRPDADHDFVFDRCREVQKNPDGHLDLWSREHYKSTIITFAQTIRDILNDPEVTVGIFSHSRPIAKGFLRQIKQEFEGNKLLLSLIPDILWDNPQSQAPKWSEDEGIIVKRKGNPKEGTIEAWGLVDGQPIGKHFKGMVYDDVVTERSISEGMLAKTTEQWALSRNLTSRGGWTRYIGTRYHFNDTYGHMMDRGVAIARVWPATHDGTFKGKPHMFTRKELDRKVAEMGPYVAACQLMQNPVADQARGFRVEWLRTYEQNPQHLPWEEMVRCIFVDPANEKSKKSDYTSMVVVGLHNDRNVYILDMLRDRLNLKERTAELIRLHRRWRPQEPVVYEKYGKDSDIEHIRDAQEQAHYRFEIIPVGGNTMSKPDRIRRLIPVFAEKRVWLPGSLHRRNWEDRLVDVVSEFIEKEYKAFPVAQHDDLLDSLARMMDHWNDGLPFPSDDVATSNLKAEVDYDPFAPSVGSVADADFDIWR